MTGHTLVRASGRLQANGAPKRRSIMSCTSSSPRDIPSGMDTQRTMPSAVVTHWESCMSRGAAGGAGGAPGGGGGSSGGGGEGPTHGGRTGGRGSYGTRGGEGPTHGGR